MSDVLFWGIIYLVLMVTTFFLVTTLMRASRDDPPPQEEPDHNCERPAAAQKPAPKA